MRRGRTLKQAREPQSVGAGRAARSTPLASLALLTLLLLCVGLVTVARARTPMIDLDIAAERLAGPAFADGIYALERGPDGQPYRWTSGSAVVQLRGAASAAPVYLLTVRLRAENTAGPQPLSFLSDGRTLATTTPEPRFRTYRMLTPPAADGELRLNLRTKTFVAPGNPRALGVVLSDLRLRPMPAADWPGAAVVAGGLLALWVTLRLHGATTAQIIAAVALSGLGLAVAAALYRPAPLPFATIAAMFLVAALVIGVMPAHPQRASAQGGGDHPPAREGGRKGEHYLPRLGMIALALSVSFSGVIWPSWISDDAFISFRYAQNLVAGNGLVYNIGERVEGYTNFLWTIIAAGVLALGGDLVIWSYVGGVALGLAILLMTYAIAARLRGPAWGFVAALVVGTSQSLLLYTARGAGLETGLFTLLALAGSACYLFADRRPAMLATAGGILALAAMTRPEGVMVFGITLLADSRLILAEWGRGRPVSWRVYLRSTLHNLQWLASAFLLIFLPYYLWRLGYYGDLLPNTFYAKTGGGLRQVLRGLSYAGEFSLTLGGPLLLLICVPWVRGWRVTLASWRGYLLPLALVYTAYIVAVGGDHFRGERFFVPVLPWLALLMADGLAALIPARPGRVATITLALLLAAGGTAALARSALIDTTISGVDESVWIWRDIGWWMADNTSPDASLAALGAGAVAYYSQHPVIDLLGLTEKHIARITVSTMGEGTAGHEKRDPAYVLHDRRPTYIPRIWDDYFGGAAGLRDSYTLITITTRSGRELEMWQRLP
ncbi:hypothetical protein K2Z83_03270 [Oscillochloris sp. ZM17-4]|uniref:ArnT family glycosyltransferase n=1 Tax=Oscillochloris sp. ZM17-4 TaxID=2866714 RepID=UPI001C72E7AD|nr:hypothetical protein [Oscillochloris sp. ZM17-4]MBX0326703.1 hypothetical protein [Oscillochloris sp. ZM17-4]